MNLLKEGFARRRPANRLKTNGPQARTKAAETRQQHGLKQSATWGASVNKRGSE